MVVDLNDDDDDNNDDERKFHATTAPSGGAGSSVTTTPSISFPGSSLDPYSLFSATTLGNPTSTLYGGGGMGDNSLASNSSSMMSATIASGDSTGVPILSEDTLKHWNVSGLMTASTAVTENVPPNSHDVTLVATTTTTGQRPPRRASTRKRKAAVPKAPATAAATTAATATIAPQPKSDSTTIVEIDSATASCPSSSEVNSDNGRYFQAVGPLRFAFIGEWSLLLDPPTSTATTTTTAASAAPAAAPTEAVPNMSLFSPLLYLSFMQSSSQQQQHPQLPAALALQGVLSAGTTTTGSSSSTTSVLRWGSPHMFEDARSNSGSTASGGGYRGRRAAAVSRSDPKVLYPEFLAYQLNLPVTRSSSILVRVQETRLDLLRALITGTRQIYRPH
jgi:hypothetical protein